MKLNLTSQFILKSKMATTCIRSKEAKPSASVHHQQRLLCSALQPLDVFWKR